jgi:hypothetical protein
VYPRNGAFPLSDPNALLVRNTASKMALFITASSRGFFAALLPPTRLAGALDENSLSSKKAL